MSDKLLNDGPPPVYQYRVETTTGRFLNQAAFDAEDLYERIVERGQRVYRYQLMSEYEADQEATEQQWLLQQEIKQVTEEGDKAA